MEKLASNKQLFIGLSSLSLGCLIGSFAYPLQKLEVYRQTKKGTFDTNYVRTYILTEDALNFPYGFQRDKARLFAQVHVDYKIQKILLLLLAAGCSVAALSVGYEVVPNAEIDDEVFQIKSRGRKELLLEAVKHRMAMASKAQRSLFHEELKALMEEYGSTSMEEEIMEADEINALYEETNQVQPASNTEENESLQLFRSQFPEQMDTTSWKACLKALGNNAVREEVIKDVLGGGDQAGAYFDFLKGKFL